MATESRSHGCDPGIVNARRGAAKRQVTHVKPVANDTKTDKPSFVTG